MWGWELPNRLDLSKRSGVCKECAETCNCKAIDDRALHVITVGAYCWSIFDLLLLTTTSRLHRHGPWPRSIQGNPPVSSCVA